jgi:hypothetical protein
MAHEGQLWEMAFKHFGSDELLQMVVDMWSHVTPARPVVEHLTTKQVSQDVLNLLKIAQERVGGLRTGSSASCGHTDLVRSPRQ